MVASTDSVSSRDLTMLSAKLLRVQRSEDIVFRLPKGFVNMTDCNAYVGSNSGSKVGILTNGKGSIPATPPLKVPYRNRENGLLLLSHHARKV